MLDSFMTTYQKSPPLRQKTRRFFNTNVRESGLRLTNDDAIRLDGLDSMEVWDGKNGADSQLRITDESFSVQGPDD